MFDVSTGRESKIFISKFLIVLLLSAVLTACGGKHNIKLSEIQPDAYYAEILKDFDCGMGADLSKGEIYKAERFKFNKFRYDQNKPPTPFPEGTIAIVVNVDPLGTGTYLAGFPNGMLITENAKFTCFETQECNQQVSSMSRCSRKGPHFILHQGENLK